MVLIKTLISYFEEVLGATPEIDDKPVFGELPYFIIDNYLLFKSRFLDLPVVFMVDTNNRHSTPGMIKKHIEIVFKEVGLEVIYVVNNMSSFNRKRLIEHRVNFVVPNNQMYLPTLKVDLRERFLLLTNKTSYFRPSAQAIILWSLINNEREISSKSIHSKLFYSSMTISRSLRQIADFGIGDLIKRGNESSLILEGTEEDVWNNVKPFMKSPVKQEVWLQSLELKQVKEPVIAGLSALSQYSMLAEPKNRVYAVGYFVWNDLKREGLLANYIEPHQTESNVKLQIWNYNPSIKEESHLVDRYSLYLSLKDEKDERIEQALEEMMKGVFNG